MHRLQVTFIITGVHVENLEEIYETLTCHYTYPDVELHNIVCTNNARAQSEEITHNATEMRRKPLYIQQVFL